MTQKDCTESVFKYLFVIVPALAFLLHYYYFFFVFHLCAIYGTFLLTFDWALTAIYTLT